MSEDVVTAELDTSLATAAEPMRRHGVGSVVVTKNGSPAGILTEADALVAAIETGRPLAEIPTTRAARSPPPRIAPARSTREAATRMRNEGIKKLVVVDGMELCGIVTLSDLVHHQNELLNEARRNDADRDEWEH